MKPICLTILISIIMWSKAGLASTNIIYSGSGITIDYGRIFRDVRIFFFDNVQDENLHIGGPFHVLRRHYGKLGGIYIVGFDTKDWRVSGSPSLTFHLLAFPMQSGGYGAESLRREIKQILDSAYRKQGETPLLRATEYSYDGDGRWSNTFGAEKHGICSLEDKYIENFDLTHKTIYGALEFREYTYLLVFTGDERSLRDGNIYDMMSVSLDHSTQRNVPQGDKIGSDGGLPDEAIYVVVGILFVIFVLSPMLKRS